METVQTVGCRGEWKRWLESVVAGRLAVMAVLPEGGRLMQDAVVVEEEDG